VKERLMIEISKEGEAEMERMDDELEDGEGNE
jgi:hypothetical protein